MTTYTMASRPSNYFGMGIELNWNGNVFLQFSINWSHKLFKDHGLPTVGDESFIGSWIRFFRELQSFIQSAQNTQHPNRDVLEYVVDRLEMWIMTVSQLDTNPKYQRELGLGTEYG